MDTRRDQEMTKQEKQILKTHLDEVYKLLNTLSNAQKQGTTEYKIVYELEYINMALKIKFPD
jgi:hypothetical protein